MDYCGFSATLQTSGGLITSIKATSTGYSFLLIVIIIFIINQYCFSSCLVGLSGIALSGSTVTVETSGSETTSWIQMTANVPQTLSLSNPISM